ncbi:acyltransferase family protein [Dactylosporangium sp. CS-033363]|uniref:acyltransferase family protein n=1 Tax=Dactylosporangium sp. CS-033363 TaxID=3239935 RepID=UPI003D90384D
MRALAVGLVLLGHAGVPLLSGGFVGVDVFFVISGFLITGLLVAEVERTGRVSLLDFYGRRAKRILPAAGVVLAASLVLTVLFLPRIRWAATGWDVVAAGVYGINWRLAERSVDYFAADQAPSIVQHCWSLAVEEQFYLIWPLLIVVLARIGRRRHVRPLLLAGLAVVAVPSFAWSVWLTASEPGRAYFVSTTRLWELGLGGALAILAPRAATLPRVASVVLGWLGLAAVVGSAVAFDAASAVPGTLALLPTLGSVALIAAGCRPDSVGPAALLSLRPVRAVGAVSYSLYLWHWPLLIAAEARFGALGPLAGVLVVLAAAGPAIVTYKWIENPARRSKALTRHPVRALQLGAAATALPAFGGLLLYFAVWPAAQPAPPLARGGPTVAGATALKQDPRGDRAGAAVDHVAALWPDPFTVREDLPDAYRDGCVPTGTGGELKSCVYGVREATTTVVLAGDSHAGHWLPALEAVATQKRWRLVVYLRNSCPMLDVEVALPHSDQPFAGCTAWNRDLRTALTGSSRPDLLLTSGTLYQPMHDGKPLVGKAGAAAQVDALRHTWSDFANAGVPVAVLRETPQPRMDMAECVTKHREELTKCAFPRPGALAGVGTLQEQAAAGLSGVSLIDLNDAICPTDPCAAAIGDALVYRDSGHLTATYAATLAPRLALALGAVPRP